MIVGYYCISTCTYHLVSFNDKAELFHRCRQVVHPQDLRLTKSAKQQCRLEQCRKTMHFSSNVEKFESNALSKLSHNDEVKKGSGDTAATCNDKHSTTGCMMHT